MSEPVTDSEPVTNSDSSADPSANPSAEPSADASASANAQMEKELRAMAEIGERRLRTRTAVFVIAVVAVVLALSLTRYFGVSIGWLYRFFIALPVAGALAFIVAKQFNGKFIADAAAKHGLAPESLAADKYLID